MADGARLDGISYKKRARGEAVPYTSLSCDMIARDPVLFCISRAKRSTLKFLDRSA